MRYLGAYPSEEELLNDILPPLCGDDEESAAGGGVRLDRFEALMVRVINDRLYEPDSEEMILQAFKVRFEGNQERPDTFLLRLWRSQAEQSQLSDLSFVPVTACVFVALLPAAAGA